MKITTDTELASVLSMPECKPNDIAVDCRGVRVVMVQCGDSILPFKIGDLYERKEDDLIEEIIRDGRRIWKYGAEKP